MKTTILSITYTTLLLYSYSALCQNKNITIYDNHGKINIETKVYNQAMNDFILNVSKYIDVKKKIIVIVGNNSFGVSPDNLKSGYSFDLLKQYGLAPIVAEPEKLIRLKLVNGKLKISSDIDGFDERYIVKIRDNKIIPSRSDYHLYASDRYFELFDEYYIPVLQIELLKNENSIFIGGAFNFDKGFTLVSKEIGIETTNFMVSKLAFTLEQKNYWQNIYLRDAKQIKPIHEE